MNMGPVKPDLPVRNNDLNTKKTFTRNHMKIKLETLVFNLHLWHFGVHGLLPSIYPSVVHPIILRPQEPAPDPVIGLPYPGALENPPGISRTLSFSSCGQESLVLGPAPTHQGLPRQTSDTVTLPGPHPLPLVVAERCQWQKLISDSDRAYQPSLMFVTSWIPNSSSIDCFSEFAGVSYLVASCSSGVF